MIIGLTGTHGAGKGTVVEYLVREKGFTHVAVSDTFLTREAKRRGLTPDRITRRDIANEYRAQSPTALMEAVYDEAADMIARGEDVVIEPQHTAAEVTFIQGVDGIEIAVDADLATRFARIQGRGSEKDHVSFDEFRKQQEFELKQDDPNMNNLGAAIAAADHVIQNDGTLEELHAQVDDLLTKLRHAGL